MPPKSKKTPEEKLAKKNKNIQKYIEYVESWGAFIQSASTLLNKSNIKENYRKISDKLEEKIMCQLPLMKKIRDAVASYIENSKEESEEQQDELQWINTRSIFYEYQFRKVLVLIYEFRYEDPINKKKKVILQKELLTKFDEIINFYDNNQEIILKSDKNKAHDISEAEDIDHIKMVRQIYNAELTGKPLPVLEKQLLHAGQIKDPVKADECLASLADKLSLPKDKYSLLRTRISSFCQKQMRQMEVNGGNQVNRDEAVKKIVVFFFARTHEKLALLDEFNADEKHIHENELIVDLFEFIDYVFHFNTNANVMHSIESCLKDAIAILENKVSIHTNHIDKLEEVKRRVKEQYPEKTPHHDTANAELIEKLRADYDAKFSEILASFGILPKTNLTRQNKRSLVSSTKEEEEVNLCDDESEEEAEAERVIIPNTDFSSYAHSEAMKLLTQAEDHKINAERHLKKRDFSKAIKSFETALSRLSESLKSYHDDEIKDSGLLKSIEIVVSHTELLMQQTLNTQKDRLEQLNQGREAAKKYIIEKYGESAWYKKNMIELSPLAKERIEAISNVAKLTVVYEDVINIKNMFSPKNDLNPKNDFLTERQSIKEGFRFFRSNCPPDREARRLTRSCSVDSFLSPEQAICRDYLKKRYGR